MLVDCPHCHMRVLPMRDQKCPSCSRDLNEVARVAVKSEPPSADSSRLRSNKECFLCGSKEKDLHARFLRISTLAQRFALGSVQTRGQWVNVRCNCCEACVSKLPRARIVGNLLIWGALLMGLASFIGPVLLRLSTDIPLGENAIWPMAIGFFGFILVGLPLAIRHKARSMECFMQPGSRQAIMVELGTDQWVDIKVGTRPPAGESVIDLAS